jgi:DNA primase
VWATQRVQDKTLELMVGPLVKILPEKLQELKNTIDLVDLISSYVPLKGSGKTYSACCPFHQEKTPSFHVYPVKQFYKCFACGSTGDAIHFIRYMEKLDFVEAVLFLAETISSFGRRYVLFLLREPLLTKKRS